MIIDNKTTTIIKYISQIKQTLAFEDKLSILANMAKELIDADRCSIWSYNLITKEFITKIAHGLDENLHLAEDDGVVGHCFLTKETILLDDVHNAGFFNNNIEKSTGYDVKSMIAMPILNCQDEVVGVIQALNKNSKDQKFTQDDIKLLELIRAYMAEVFESTLLYDNLEFKIEKAVSDNKKKDQEYLNKLTIKFKELEEYKRVLDESNILSKTDLDGNITYVNKKFEDISGYKYDELIGKPHNTVRHPDVPKEIFKELWDSIKNKKTFQGVIKNKRKNGNPYYVDATITPILDVDGNIKEYIGIRHDITNIMNPKKLFLDEIKIKKDPIAILGKIKNYNLLKEFYGESYIQIVEDYITQNILLLLPEDTNIDKVYQLDNGEYTFLKESNNVNPTDIENCLINFRNNIIGHEFIIADKKIDIDFYFAFTTEKEFTFENLKIGIQKAQQNKEDIVFANNLASKQKIEAQKNMKIVDILKLAINKTSNAKLVSYFQPIINNKTNKIEKYESLVRLINDDGSVISPFFFIDIAKKAGYYNQITNIVLDNSFEALDKTDKDITINLSTMDIENINNRNKLLELISNPKYHNRVVFELLEDEVAKDFNMVKDFISLAKVVGKVKIAIDDFGSGYSNFERLLDFQPDILKIDGSLIKNIVNDTFSQHVVEAIVLFSKKENIQTVAEFVADEDIMNKVKSMGIDYSQGFHLGKPEPLE